MQSPSRNIDIATYLDQAEALVHRDELLELGIAAEVEIYEPAHLGATFIVKVPEDQMDLVPSVELPPALDIPSMVSCPYCGSSDVEEIKTDGCLQQMLILPVVVNLFLRRAYGIPYVCAECSQTFRFSYRGKGDT